MPASRWQATHLALKIGATCSPNVGASDASGASLLGSSGAGSRLETPGTNVVSRPPHAVARASPSSGAYGRATAARETGRRTHEDGRRGIMLEDIHIDPRRVRQSRDEPPLRSA